MTELHLLLVEDDPGDQNVCETTVRRYQAERQRAIRLTKVSSKAEAQRALNNEVDAAIVDLKLGNDPEAGVTLIDEIRNRWRIPVAVFTATPSNIDDRSGLVHVYKKGETQYTEVLDRLLEIFDTGLTRIFGGRGLIEREMDRVFWHAVLPFVQAWPQHQKSGKSTEKALLRFAIGHLMELLHDDAEAYFAEEAYVIPVTQQGIPASHQLRTGSIVRKKDQPGGDSYVVITPSCDLVVRGNGIKTERLLTCSIEDLTHHAIKKARKMCNAAIPESDIEAAKLAHQQRQAGNEALKKICSNNYCGFLHFLPAVRTFNGGLVNFRRLEAFSPSDFDKKFASPFLQISPMFMKDVISRFSAYYARHGQPDLDFERLAADLAKEPS